MPNTLGVETSGGLVRTPWCRQHPTVWIDELLIAPGNSQLSSLLHNDAPGADRLGGLALPCRCIGSGYGRPPL